MTPSPLPPTPPTPSTDDDRAIRALHDEWIAAVNAGDVARLLALVTDDVVFLTPGQPPTGRDGFRDNVTAGHRRHVLTCASRLEEVVVAGDLAVARSRDALSLSPRPPREATDAPGAQVALAGDRLTVYRRQADGAWRLARDIHTLLPVAA